MPNNDDKTVVTSSGNQVDESLSTDAGSSRRRTADQQRELEELQAELRYLRIAARRPPVSHSLAASGAARSLREEIEYQIRLQPIAAVALASVVGFAYGIAR